MEFVRMCNKTIIPKESECWKKWISSAGSPQQVWFSMVLPCWGRDSGESPICGLIQHAYFHIVNATWYNSNIFKQTSIQLIKQFNLIGYLKSWGSPKTILKRKEESLRMSSRPFCKPLLSCTICIYIYIYIFILHIQSHVDICI